MITITKLYVPVITLSINNDIKFLETQSKDSKKHFLEIDIGLKKQNSQKAKI